jgi:hypothetical protein
MKYLNAFVTVLLFQLGKGIVCSNSCWTRGRELSVRLYSVGGVFTSRDGIGFEVLAAVDMMPLCRLVTGNAHVKQDC